MGRQTVSVTWCDITPDTYFLRLQAGSVFSSITSKAPGVFQTVTCE